MLVRGPNMAGQAEVRQWVETMNQEAAPAGVHFTVKRLRTVANAYPRFDRLDLTSEKFIRLYRLSARRGWLRPRRWITSWIVPGAMGTDNLLYSYGWANGICKLGRLPMTMSTGVRRQLDGGDRLNYGRTALNHELGHIVGAEHDQSNCNIMKSDGLTCLRNIPTLHFNYLAQYQINQCVR